MANTRRQLRQSRHIDALSQHGHDQLLIYFHNVGGMGSASQMSAVRSALFDAPYDVVLIETWFTTDVMSSEVFNSSDWLVMRCDRGDLGDHRRGGGVLIAVKRTLVAGEILVENAARIEQCWARIQLPEYALYLGGVYLPPGSDVSSYDQVISSTRMVIDSSDAADRILVFGDFNCVLDWMPDPEDPSFMRVNDGPATNVEFVDSMSATQI